MAYYLTIKEKQNYKLLDVTGMEEFKRISKFKNSSYSLEEIDMFSSQFHDEFELKRKLYEGSVITLADITKAIEIRRKYDGKLEKVTYDLIYRYNINFLDIQYLKHLFLTLQNDEAFIRKLLSRYRNKKDTEEELFAIRAILNGYVDTDINIYNELNKFFINTVEDKNGNIKYKSLHDLAVFIYNYLLTKTLGETTIALMKETTKVELEKLKQSLTPKEEKVDLKIKIRNKKYDLDGQTSLF